MGEPFNMIWLLFVLLAIVAFLVGVRRRMAKQKAQERNQINTQTTFVRPSGQEVRIHMTRPLHPPIEAPVAVYHRDNPPAFDSEEPAPPSYQDFNKDVLIQSSRV